MKTSVGKDRETVLDCVIMEEFQQHGIWTIEKKGDGNENLFVHTPTHSFIKETLATNRLIQGN